MPLNMRVYICCEGVPGHGIQALEEFPVDLWKITFFNIFSVNLPSMGVHGSACGLLVHNMIATT